MHFAAAAAVDVGFVEDTDSLAAGAVAPGVQRYREEKRDLGLEGVGMIVGYVGYVGSGGSAAL